MLQEFLRRGKKWADKPDSNFREGTSAELGICSWPGGFRPAVEIFQKAALEVVDCCGGFCGAQNPKEKYAQQICREIRQPKTKIRQRTTPPKSTSKTPKFAAKPTNKSACQTSKCKPGVFRLRALALGGIFRAWILGHSLGAFWAWLTLPC